MYCLYCGEQIKDGLRFCTHCGMPQNGEVSQETEVIEPIRPVTREPKARQQERTWMLPAVIAVLLLVQCGLGLVAWRIGLLGGGSSTDGKPPSATRPLDEDDAYGSLDEQAGRATGADEWEEENDIPDDEGEGDIAADTPTVRAGLPKYSWDELSEIAQLIESCSSSSDALAIAQKYHLVDANGRYSKKTKDVHMANGETMRMRLVGVWHDESDTPSGKAGLSFLSDGSSYGHRMDVDTVTQGGWGSSEMRKWMHAQFIQYLPDEVVDVIQPVYKRSNNVGKTMSRGCVTETYDTIWLPSIVELCGPVSWEFHTDPANSDYYSAVFNAEGEQYEAFAQESIKSDDANPVLALGEKWWLRSTAASSGRGRFVDESGDPSKFGDSDVVLEVVPGFCL